MDEIDAILISALQQNARVPIKALTQKVFLSSPAISARIEKLEKSGLISGYHASIDPFQLGYYIEAFINLQMSPNQKPEFYPFIRSCPNVVECNCVTGTYSMLIKVISHNTMELDEFIGKLQKFGPTETQIVFSTPVKPRGIDIFKSLKSSVALSKHSPQEPNSNGQSCQETDSSGCRDTQKTLGKIRRA
jgi:Lrp/AsnC family leucine-responsive transcriptional regulator